MGRRLRRCLVCGYTTAFHTSMQNHQRIHTGERPHKCDYCGKAFMQKGNLVAHLRIHTGERPFRCHLCSMAFTQKTSLVGHVRTHTGEKPFQCRFCPMVFARKMQLKRHEEMHTWCADDAVESRAAAHPNQSNGQGLQRKLMKSETIPCDYRHLLTESFVPPNTQNSHGGLLEILEVSIGYINQCCICHPFLLQFSPAEMCMLHALLFCRCCSDSTGQQKEYCINEANSTFRERTLDLDTSRRQRSAHQCVHNSPAKKVGTQLTETRGSDLCPSENVPVNESYICSYCSKSFNARGNLNTHLRIHTGERPFQCHLCPRAFTQKVTLVHHVRTHTGERPFQCRFCLKAFVRKLERKDHEIRKHLKGTATY
nr:zinc finger protein 84-like [Dermacentor andersoni]